MSKALPITFAEELADAAGAVLRQYFRAPITPEMKADDTPVTRADREAEQAMRQMITEKFPDHGILGEEFGAERRDAEYIWVLDPLDGTRAFIAGKPQFVILIALLRNGVPVMGIIDQPMTKERWIGMEEKPTTLNGKKVKTRTCASLESAVLATTSPYLFRGGDARIFEALRRQCRVKTYGGDGYNYALIASGTVDVVLESGLKPYDFLALAPIIQGAGGTITDWRGGPLTLNANGQVLACGDPALHAHTMQFIKEQAAV